MASLDDIREYGEFGIEDNDDVTSKTRYTYFISQDARNKFLEGLHTQQKSGGLEHKPRVQIEDFTFLYKKDGIVGTTERTSFDVQLLLNISERFLKITGRGQKSTNLISHGVLQRVKNNQIVLNPKVFYTGQRYLQDYLDVIPGVGSQVLSLLKGVTINLQEGNNLDRVKDSSDKAIIF